MLRRNFLSFLGCSPLSFLMKKNDDNEVINIPKGRLCRIQNEWALTSESMVYEKHIVYMLDGLNHRDDGPSVISIAREKSNSGVFCQWQWNNHGKTIKIVSIASLMWNYYDYRTCDEVRWYPLFGGGEVYRQNKHTEFSNVGEKWFEEQIGMTLEQLYSFN